MAFTPAEESRIRVLLGNDSALNTLAQNEPAIIQELGAQDVTIDELQIAASIADSDKLLGRFGGEDKSLTLLALKDALKGIGVPVLHRDWSPLRTAIHSGQAPADGQLIENGRDLYPDAWAAIQAGLVPVCTEAEWLANPSKRGCYTVGNGSTNFRLPDYNGKSAGALGAVAFRGDGKNAAPAGDVQGDAIRNITGTLAGIRTDIGKGIYGGTGAFKADELIEGNKTLWGSAAINKTGTAVGGEFDASLVVPTAPENRMVNVAGCWTIHLFGVVLNSGSVDAASIATAMAGLSARVSTLESFVNDRKSTCLVNAVGTGAPHETVATQLPTSVAINSRYVLSNPFGNNTPVICWAELLINGVWADSGFIFFNGAGGHGVSALYAQGAGIVVQTGGTAVATTANNSGGGHGVTNTINAAPCRVFVRKLGV